MTIKEFEIVKDSAANGSRKLQVTLPDSQHENQPIIATTSAGSNNDMHKSAPKVQTTIASLHRGSP